MEIVLYQPEIPQNTGNIARTCVITNTPLHLVKPLGFDLSERSVRRAGLDYWELLQLEIHENFEEFEEKYRGRPMYFLTTKATKCYADIDYEEDGFLIFGKETAGLPEELHRKYRENRFRIPMIEHEKARSLNLSNCVNVVLYEVLRQHGFKGLR
ncbi:MAG TPA: tRNA (uridine(34)/cytosine(34)/5-carboxymethylaminomethyluridine(34)-2'-O)-methyltransferase TrmL [Eubacteriaceae bacterium]|nr:tRNA (uridine(34)/cytosine(34)/5-carboxymethylaminomethyluridine(34)-2'-O)-methyltransferase TrmL [Eubacteriaceae bacterium]